MRNYLFLLLVVALIALLGRFQNVPNHGLTIRDEGDGFRFFVEPLPDGRYRYTAELVHMPFPVSAQKETGILGAAFGKELFEMQTVPVVPSGHSIAAETWGSLERGGRRIPLCYSDWWRLEKSVVGESYHRLGFKAKASI